MGKTPIKEGLCSTCDNAKSCTLDKNMRSPVLECEEFIIYSPPATKYESENLPPSESMPNSSDIENFLGLCANCENRQSCKLRKPDGGVWHCEEYK